MYGIDDARNDIRNDLSKCCEEILSWHSTTILENGIVREVAGKLKPLVGWDHLKVVENLINEEALKAVVNGF